MVQGFVTQREPFEDGQLRVVVVDDHATFGELLELAINAEPGVRCVGVAHGARTGLELIRRTRPDVVVMDVELGDGDGVEVTAEVTAAFPDVRVVVLSARVDSRVMRRALAAGACGLLPKSGPLVQALRVIREARRGGLEIDPTLLRALMMPQEAPARPDLTARELEVLELLALGMDVRRISAQLSISPHTCRGHVKRILSKLDAHSQLEAVATALKLGLIRTAASA